MAVPLGAETAILGLARLFARKHARGDIVQMIADAGVRFAAGDKFANVYGAMTQLNNAGDMAGLELLIDRLSTIHTLSAEDTKLVLEYKRVIGLGRAAAVDLGPYGGLRLNPDTRNMIRAYATLRTLENELRLFIHGRIKSVYGEGWLEIRASHDVQESVRRARQKETDSFWQSVKPDSDVFYTDFKDLKSIISTNWDLFRSVFVDQAMVFKKLEELELSRNIIAHNRVLTEIELERLNVYAHDILKSIGVLKE